MLARAVVQPEGREETDASPRLWRNSNIFSPFQIRTNIDIDVDEVLNTSAKKQKETGFRIIET